MAASAVRETVSLRLPAAIMDDLQAHLFREDADEHGAVIGASVLITERGLRLIGRRLFLAQDGVDYVSGIRGYRRLTPEFVRRCVRECAEERLAYLAVHNHFGTNRVAFSTDDMASHRRGYPALIDILDGLPAGALVFAQNAVAGDIWLSHDEQVALDCATVVAATPRLLYPEPQRPPDADARYDRQVRLFGDRGQHILATQRVGIVGLGGVGSLINEYLARLGVGHIVAIDDDFIDETNYPRLVGSRPKDLGPRWLPSVLARWLGRQPARKVAIAERLALDAKPDIGFDAVEADVMEHDAVERLVDCDAIFLAADTMRARLVVNAVCHQYLIPVWQVGTKIQVDVDAGDIEDVFSVVRHRRARTIVFVVHGTHRSHAARRGERLASTARCPALHRRNPGPQCDHPQRRRSSACSQRLPACHRRTHYEQFTSGVDEAPSVAAPPCTAADAHRRDLHRMQGTTRRWTTSEAARKAAGHR